MGVSLLKQADAPGMLGGGSAPEGLRVPAAAESETERALRIERERLALALTAGQMGVYDWSVKANLLWWSPEIYAVFGVDPDSFTPTPESLTELMHPEDRDAFWQHLQECMRQRQYFVHEFRIQRPDGQLRWIGNRAQTEYDETGAAVRNFGVAIDITERKKAEMRAVQNAGLFSTLIDQAPIGTYVVDGNLRMRQINPVAMPAFSSIEPLIGRSLEEVMGILWEPEVCQGILAQFRHTLETGERYLSPRFAHVRHDRGKQEAYEWETQRVMLPEGGHGVVCYFNDVTERKVAEEALIKSERFNVAVLDSLPAEIAVLDREGRIIAINKPWLNFSQGPEEVMAHRVGVGVDYLEVCRKAAAEGDAEAMQTLNGIRSVLEGEATEFKLEYACHAPGRDQWFAMHVLRAPTEVGGAIVAHTDITERRELESALVANAAQLAEADRRKDEFLAMLAHELRNPLAPMRNTTEVLRTEGVSAADKEQSLGILARQIENMSRMIDDLLDVSRITQGKIALRRQPVALNGILEAAVNLAQAGCMARGQKLVLLLPDEPVHLDADATRLEQVFGNLLSNARKYSADGGPIEVTARRDGNEVVVTVRDQGVGIDPQLLSRIFELFVQESRTLDRERGGLGIGLTLAERLVKLHGGSIVARSGGIGRGAEFSVRLPVLVGESGTSSPLDMSAPAAPREEQKTSRRILIVDDNADSARSLALLQTRRGHVTRTAFTGPDAVALAAEFLPEIVILDIGLPGMDGLEVARQLRALPALAGVLLVAMSGYGSEEDVTAGKRAGFDEYLVKPVDLKRLRELIP